MSVDKLQERIRKCKNPSVVDFFATPEQIPPHILQEEGNFTAAYNRFCRELLQGLKGIVPAVRFSCGGSALLGDGGIPLLRDLLQFAADQGFYVFLDGVEALSAHSAQRNAELMFSQELGLSFDGLILSSYIGSDGLRPFAQKAIAEKKGLYVVARTANRSAPELQDLLTGSRLVHAAAADISNRLADSTVGKSGYGQIGVMAGASSAESLRNLRAKYKYLFLLLDGYDYPNSNAKNCAYAFDSLGHGAAACASSSITAAWLDDSTDGKDYIDCAVRSAERMKKNLTRYITIL